MIIYEPLVKFNKNLNFTKMRITQLGLLTVNIIQKLLYTKARLTLPKTLNLLNYLTVF